MTDLPPGRMLDVRVAKNVMGLQTRDGYSWHRPGAPHLSFAPELYSTDIAAAWTVLEKMRAQLPGQEIMLYYCDGWAVGSLCQAGGTIEIGDFGTEDDALTAPHAICLAALELVKVT